MNKAEKWQDRVIKFLRDSRVQILNPRRDDWDSSWEQNKNNLQFRQQVEWELEAQEKADKIIMYFDPNTKSPISLLELGLFAKSGKLVVVCPEGFWRKGNVDIVCEKYGVKQVKNLEEAVSQLK